MITRQIAPTKTPPTILSSSCSKCFSINPSSHLNASNPMKTSKAITPNMISLKKKIKGKHKIPKTTPKPTEQSSAFPNLTLYPFLFVELI